MGRKMIDFGMRKSSPALPCVWNSHFHRFRKSRKIDAKMDPKSHAKSIKMDHGAVQGRFIHKFYGFWAVSKNRRFLMARCGAKRLIKIDPWGAKVRQRRPGRSAGLGFRGFWPTGRHPIIKEIR